MPSLLTDELSSDMANSIGRDARRVFLHRHGPNFRGGLLLHSGPFWKKVEPTAMSQLSVLQNAFD